MRKSILQKVIGLILNQAWKNSNYYCCPRIEGYDDRTVAEVEKDCRELFGLDIQVFRKF